uniref:cystathionine beta-synthase n=1 Tax=Octactis speculum TaxID=3111310 RepID=A0A7S2CK18_9STRA|mmetsp:Transcript_3690/g.4236  ORF Transcript_3690/g.4236 Transcript_3690/m.4236 type:complete len:551 (+) Transcript_3690:42-1694(+)|eukprot:CAMPEP_0185767084 /NCGR_PEP_ID=MMETSP1174-20130828/41660_1 /TAXON_ID=35687 /ORGANISM="Dictyocha speculum, Strain CCMP1381" /LENGTH=550 /DNA_ID=CAMNT_0028451107 /DNA_START=42 /DNA_END=1694 /DNA_ORIENTATION=+
MPSARDDLALLRASIVHVQEYNPYCTLPRKSEKSPPPVWDIFSDVKAAVSPDLKIPLFDEKTSVVEAAIVDSQSGLEPEKEGRPCNMTDNPPKLDQAFEKKRTRKYVGSQDFRLPRRTPLAYAIVTALALHAAAAFTPYHTSGNIPGRANYLSRALRPRTSQTSIFRSVALSTNSETTSEEDADDRDRRTYMIETAIRKGTFDAPKKNGFRTEPAPTGSGRFVSNIGATPLVELTSLATLNNLRPDVKIFLKCEFMNPGNSIKDRIAEHILNEAERTGKIQPGGTVVAASSGNTAAAFAMLCAARGYKAVVITNTKCSDEKVAALTAYGAKAIVTRAGVPPDHPEHYQNVEDRLVAENPGWFGVNQYDNPLNPEAYYHTLAPEIWAQSEGKVTHFFAAASTGGTITGIGTYLKEKTNGAVRVISPDPVGSIFSNFWETGEVGPCKSFEVEGVGKDSIPKAMNFDIIDEMPSYTDKESFQMCRLLAAKEGLVCGGSTGLNVHAALEVAKTLDGPATLVCVAPDSGIKYLSKIYNDTWMASNGFSSDTVLVE